MAAVAVQWVGVGDDWVKTCVPGGSIGQSLYHLIMLLTENGFVRGAGKAACF